MTVDQRALAQFVDRWTMLYERRFPHPIGLVWEAVSTGEHLDVWMLPVSRVDRRVGGRCSFTWGSPEEDGMQIGEVTEFDPPHAVTYSFAEPAGSMRFALAPDGDGTLLHFTLRWPVPPGTQLEPEDYPGGDLPAGPSTAWRPGFLAGFHEFLDDFAEYLDGRFTADDRAAHLADQLAGTPSESFLALVDRYREHVAANCPSA